MDKKNLISGLFLALLFLFSCQKSDYTEMDTIIQQPNNLKIAGACNVSLIAGQTINIGEVSVNYINNSIVDIIYQVTDPAWCLVETHLDVQSDPANFFTTNSGNPKIGHFTFSSTLNCDPNWIIQVDLTTIPGWTEGSTLYIAAHAVVENQSTTETAWGQGESFPGNSWAMYFNCEPPQGCGQPFVDPRDGQSYNTVLIGDQCWMAENLNIGVRINANQVSSNNGIIEKYCYDNDPANCDTYGGFYRWDEMLNYNNSQGTQGICPDGWHIPTDEDWNNLEGAFDSQYGIGDPEWNNIGWRGLDAGYNLKSTTSWTGAGNGSNISGFSVLAAGYYDHNRYYDSMGEYATFWTSTTAPNGIWIHRFWDDHNDAHRGYEFGHGRSVRCIKN